MARTLVQSLPKEEWDFVGLGTGRIPTWQWNEWLDYEYARSCRPIIEAVLELRSRKITPREAGTWPVPQKFPQHAVYLANHYPDLPRQPWLSLPPAQRNRQSETLDHVGGPFEADTLLALDPFDFADQIARGDIWLDRKNVADHKYSVFKIDFLRDKKLIEKKFRRWLEQRQRDYLRTRTAAQEKISSLAATPPRFSKDVRSGQAGNKRIYVTAFKQLAALRLLEHFDYDYQRCGSETAAGPDDAPLYYGLNNTRWFDAANQAAERLVIFNIMWQLEQEPAYFFKFDEFHETLKWHPKLRADLAATRSIKKLKNHLKTLYYGQPERHKICSSR